MSITRISEKLEVPISEVMEVLGVDWYCSLCKRGVDLSDGRTSYAAVGDEDRPYWGTGCDDYECLGSGDFIGRSGAEYVGTSPMRECVS